METESGVPDLFHRDIRARLDKDERSGHPLGTSNAVDYCCSALDKLVEANFYLPRNGGTSYAARLIREIFEPGIGEGTIARHIEKLHEELRVALTRAR